MITLDRAIELTKLDIAKRSPEMPSDVLSAHKMSLAALVQIRLWRDHEYPMFQPPLTEETPMVTKN